MVSGDHINSFDRFIEVALGIGWRDVPDRPEKAAVVEPFDLFQCFPFHGIGRSPRSKSVDDLGLEQADDRFGQRVVIRVADAAHRWLQSGLDQALGVAN